MEIKQIKTMGNIEYYATKQGDILRKMKHKPRRESTKRERIIIKDDTYTKLKGYTRGKERHKKNHYVAVDLSGRGTVSIHRLIAESFIGEIGSNVVNHINGIKNDNRLENLEIVSHQYNLQHAIDTGLRKSLNYNQIHTDLTTTYLTQREISDKNDCSETSIEKYVNKYKIKRPADYSSGRNTNRTRAKLKGSKWYIEDKMIYAG